MAAPLVGFAVKLAARKAAKMNPVEIINNP